MYARFGIDELGVYAHLVLIALNRAFERIAHTEFLADFLDVDRFALKRESRVPCDNRPIAGARQFGSEVLCDAIGEVILARIVREICERQHDDG